MNQSMTRRRFGQLVLAATAGAGSVTFASRLLAQTALTKKSSVLVGVNFSNQGSSVSPRATTASSQLVVQSLDLKTGKVQTQTSIPIQPLTNAPQSLQPYKQVSALTSLLDGTLVIATNPSIGREQANPTRLTTVQGLSSQTLNVSKLAPHEALWSLLGTNDGSLIGLVAKTNGSFPYKLVNIDIQTGQVSFISFTLPTDEWFSNLTQCPDGKIYATAARAGGDISLVQLDLKQGQLIRLPQLSFNGRYWRSGLNSLTCSPGNKFLALAAPNRHTAIKNLYTVEPGTGAMSLRGTFDVTQITFTLA
jgi:WD40 repeat protein